MKYISTLFLISIFFISCNQIPKGYVIQGTVENMQEGKIYLKSFRNKMFFDYDSTHIINGKFIFQGKVDEPLLFGLATENMRYPTQFFVENVEMNVLMNEEGKILVENSPQNEIFLSNAPRVHEAGYSIDSLISRYPDSPAAAFYLYRYFTYQLSLEELKATRSKISSSLASLPYVVDLDEIINKLENVEIGKTAPDFTLPDPEGNEISLSDFRGKYVLVDFWAAWCPPCRRENPNVVQAYQTYKDKDFTVLGVSLDYSKNNWLKAIEDDKLTWTHVSDLKYWDSEIPALYGVRGIPANVLLDPQGVIIAKNITGEELQNKLREVIQ